MVSMSRDRNESVGLTQQIGKLAIHAVWPLLAAMATWVYNVHDTMIRQEDHIEYLDQRVVSLEQQISQLQQHRGHHE